MSAAIDLILMKSSFSVLGLPNLRLWLDAQNEAVRRNLTAPTLVDGFNRADGALGSAPTGQAYSVVSGTWTIASGTARCDNTANGEALLGVSAFNCRFSGRIRSTLASTVPRLQFRRIDSNNFLTAVYYSGGLELYKRDGGVYTLLASGGAAYVANTWRNLEVRLSGDVVTVFLDGVSTVTHTLIGGDATKFGTANSANATGLALGRNIATAATVEVDDICVSSGASALLLDQWSDDSGNAFHFTQATATKQPLLTWTVNALGVLVPVVRGDGVDDSMVYANSNISNALFGHVHAAVARTGENVLLSSADEGTAGNAYCYVNPRNSSNAKMRIGQRSAADTAELIDGTILSLNTPYLLDWDSDGSAYHQWINNAAQALTATSGANNGDWFGDTAARDSFSLFCLKTNTESSFASADVHSIVVTDSVITPFEVAHYNNLRYGMGITL